MTCLTDITCLVWCFYTENVLVKKKNTFIYNSISNSIKFVMFLLIESSIIKKNRNKKKHTSDTCFASWSTFWLLFWFDGLLLLLLLWLCGGRRKNMVNINAAISVKIRFFWNRERPFHTCVLNKKKWFVW